MDPRRVRNKKGLWPKIAMMAIWVLLVLSVPASAAAVTLAWNPNTEPDLAGYKIYIGTSSGTYTQAIDAGRVTTFAVPDPPPGETRYFAVTAYDIFANESGFSNQVSMTAPVAAPPAGTTPPSSSSGEGTGETTKPSTTTPPAETRPPSSGDGERTGERPAETTTPPSSSREGTARTTTPPANNSPSVRAAGLLRQHGQQLYEQGRYRAAIRAYNQALRIHLERRDLENRALVLEDLGRAYEALGDSKTAARKYEMARRIRQRLADNR